MYLEKTNFWKNVCRKNKMLLKIDLEKTKSWKNICRRNKLCEKYMSKKQTLGKIYVEKTNFGKNVCRKNELGKWTLHGTSGLSYFPVNISTYFQRI